MKKLFLVLSAVLALSLAVAAQENGGLQFNGLEVLTTKAEVIQKFGKPRSSRKKIDDNECRGDLLVLRYPGFTLELEGGGSGGKFVIATATVTSPKWSVSGIKIGASISEVKKKLTFGDSERKKGLDYLYYYNGDGYAEFVFQKGNLRKIHWEFNFC